MKQVEGVLNETISCSLLSNLIDVDLLIIAKEDTTPADIDVEEAFRMIVSSGIVGNHKNSIVK